MTHRGAVLGLVAVVAVWGCSFTVVKGALADASPLVLVAIRFLLASLLVVPFFRGITRRELAAGAIVGLLFCGGIVLQTSGLEHTTPSRSAFITGLMVPLTPLVFVLVHRALPRVGTLAAVALAAVGTYFLTAPDAGGLNRGDLLTLVGAVFFAGQVVAAGHYARIVAPRHLLAVQLSLTGSLALAAAPLAETPRLELTPLLLAAVAFLGCSAVATFGFQLRAQQVVSPAQTALIFSLEPVVAALMSYILLGETLGALQWLGGGLILAAMLLPEVAGMRRAREVA